MAILFVMLLMAGACVLYLSHRHQCWLAQPLTPIWRLIGLGLLILALGCGLQYFTPIVAVFMMLVVLMLLWGLLPFVSLLPFIAAKAGVQCDDN